MVPSGEREAVELFQLRFLQMIGAELRDRVAVKGGCNLRFFFGSPRYSEDIDLDVSITRGDTLAKNVEKILTRLDPLLRASKITISKQTPDPGEATQRWKIHLSQEGFATPFHTKIEFSRRHATEKFEPADVEYTQVPREIAARYELQPVRAVHYRLPAAIRQKIVALAKRKETQARDVFDLSLLLSRSNAEPVLTAEIESLRHEAIERARSLSYREFESQVVAYLLPEMQGAHDEYTWEYMQEDVVKAIESLT